MKKVVYFAIAFLLASCASTPHQRIDHIALVRQNIVKGQSTKEDVIRLLGKPQNKTTMDYSAANMPTVGSIDTAALMPYEMWTYSWVNESFPITKEPGKMFPLFGTIGHSIHTATLVFNFDREGKVVGYTTNESGE